MRTNTLLNSHCPHALSFSPPFAVGEFPSFSLHLHELPYLLIQQFSPWPTYNPPQSNESPLLQSNKFYQIAYLENTGHELRLISYLENLRVLLPTLLLIQYLNGLLVHLRWVNLYLDT